jgi:hypothetical protein
MASRFGRTQRKVGNVAARRRLTIRPKADRLWLLAGTAIITGAVMWPTHPALAACVPDGNPGPATGATFTCTGAVETDPQLYEPGVDGFVVTIGQDPDGQDGGIQVPAGDGGNAAALTIDGDDAWGGTVDVFDGSMIETLDTDVQNGLEIFDVNHVTVTVHGGDSDLPAEAAGYIYGTNNGLSVTSSFNLAVFNNGAIIGADTGDGISALSVTDNSVFGPTVLIVNSGFSDDTDIFGGGLIGGTDDGIELDQIAGTTIIKNGGYWTDETLPDEILDGGMAFREGGLIFGETGDGVDIVDFDVGVFIDNLHTLDSNIDMSVPLGGLTLPSIASDPAAPVTAGIWGDEYGVFIDGNGFGDFVGIGNFNGLIVGAHNDGIYIEDINGGSPIGAVSVFNGDGGIITGSETGSGIHIENSRFGVFIDNAGLSESTIGYFIFAGSTFGEDESPFAPNAFEDGFTGGYIVGDADGIEIEGVEDDIFVFNGQGEIWGTGASSQGGTGIEIVSAFEDFDDAGNVMIASGFIGFGEDSFIGEDFLNPYIPITDGGFIYGNGRAVTVAGATRAGVYNGEGGFILGRGGVTDPLVESTPLIYLFNSNEGSLGEDFIPGEDEFVTWNQASSQVINYGLMGSYFLPHLQVGDFADIGPGEVPDYEFDEEAFADDIAGLQGYIWNGGSMSQLDGFIAPDTEDGDEAENYQIAAG